MGVGEGVGGGEGNLDDSASSKGASQGDTRVKPITKFKRDAKSSLSQDKVKV